MELQSGKMGSFIKVRNDIYIYMCVCVCVLKYFFNNEKITLKYVGQWLDDKQHGNGVLLNSDGKEIQRGKWVQNVFTSLMF